MENTEQSSRPDARIIHLRTLEKLIRSDYHESNLSMMLELQAMEYVNQLLDEHFKRNEAPNND